MGSLQLEGEWLPSRREAEALPCCTARLPNSLLSLLLHYLPLQRMWGCDTSWDRIENKDLFFACYSGKTPTGISEPLNSTVCCKWNCLLCSVGAGYSQLSLLTQLHENSPSCHPTLQCSLGPVLFPLKRWNKWSQQLHHLLLLNPGALEKQWERLGHRVGVRDSAIHTASWAKGDLSTWDLLLLQLTPLETAHQNHGVKQSEYWQQDLASSGPKRQTVPCSPALWSRSFQVQPLTVEFSSDIRKLLTEPGIRTYRYCCNLLGFINSPCSLFHTYHLGTPCAAGCILV